MCAHLSGVDALARRREARLVLRLENDVDHLEHGTLTDLIGHDTPVVGVGLGKEARAGGDHVGRWRANHGAPVKHSQPYHPAQHGARARAKGKRFWVGNVNGRSPLLLLLLLKLPLELLRDVGGLGPHGGCGHSTRADARVRGGG